MNPVSVAKNVAALMLAVAPLPAVAFVSSTGLEEALIVYALDTRGIEALRTIIGTLFGSGLMLVYALRHNDVSDGD